MPQTLSQNQYGESAWLWDQFASRHASGLALDEASIRIEVSRIDLAFDPINIEKLNERIGLVFSSEFEETDLEEARQQIVRGVLRPALIEWPLRRALEKKEGFFSYVLEWTRQVEQLLETALDQCGEPEGPFRTDQFRQQIEEREELVSGVLVANQLGLVAAATKSMKTTCMVDMAISLATATPWLENESWSCRQPNRVLFCSAESGHETLIHKHDVISQVKRGELPVDQQEQFDRLLTENLLWDCRLPDLGDAGSRERFVKKVRDHNIQVVILDPLSLAVGSAGSDLPNLAVGGQVILKAAAAFRRVGATLVLVHHTSGDRWRQQAGRGHGPLELQDAAYPSITNHVRQWILLSRAEPYGLPERRSVLWVRIGGSGLQAGGDVRATITEGTHHDQWDVRIESEAQYIEGESARREIAAEAERRDQRSRVLEFLRVHPGATRNSMIEDTQSLDGIGRGKLGRLIPDLLSRRAIRMEQDGPSRRYFVTHAGGVQTEAESS